MTSDPRWFDGAAARAAAGQRFVERLRALAPAWIEYGITAERSRQLPLAAAFVGVELPHLTTTHRWLWIKFHEFDGGLSLECSWGDERFLDDWPLMDGDLPLTVPDPSTSPAQLAELASEWVMTEAARVVRREDWYGVSPAVRWTFTDTGALLWYTRWWPWRPRRPPDKVRLEQVTKTRP